MGNTTTFEALIAEPRSEKIFLAEIKVSEQVTGWTLTAEQTNTYEISYLNETVRLANGTTETIRKAVIACEGDGTALTVRDSIANVEANAGSYWHDTATSKLYVHTAGSDNPNAHTICAFFWLYFGSKGIILNSIYYEPYIADKGIPNIKQSNPKLYWGVSALGGGSLKLLNSRGYFDQISKNFIWINKTVIIKMGGDSLPYSEYETLYTGKINDVDFSRDEFVLKLVSTTWDLFKSIPTSVYSTGTYPNMDSGGIGKPIPIMYGDFSTESLAVRAMCIDSSYALITAGSTIRFKFKICGHAIDSITQVYVDFDDGHGWQTIAHTSEDLTNAQFCIACTGPSSGPNESTAYRITDSAGVKVAFKGKKSGSTLIEKGVGIVHDILASIMGLSTSLLNSTAFQQSRTDAHAKLVVPIEKEQDAKRIIEKICASDVAFFDEDETGDFRYRLWKPIVAGEHPSLDESDFLGEPKINLDSEQLYWKYNIGYHYNAATTSYRYYSTEDTQSKYKFEREETLKIDTYLRDRVDARILAQRLKLLMRDPTATIDGQLKTPIVNKLIGDKVNITLKRSPFGTSGGWNNRLFEISARNLKCYPVENKITLFDLKEFGGSVGYWTSTDSAILPWSTNWNNAGTSDRERAGYWHTTDGYVDGTTKNANTLNQSLWW